MPEPLRSVTSCGRKNCTGEPAPKVTFLIGAGRAGFRGGFDPSHPGVVRQFAQADGVTMQGIRAEIQAVADGKLKAEDSPLHHAPHTAESLLIEAWDRPYSRAQAAFPMAELKDNKYWPPVGRIDQVYGDRHLVCSCPPVSAYETQD